MESKGGEFRRNEFAVAMKDEQRSCIACKTFAKGKRRKRMGKDMVACVAEVSHRR
jgi:hypothetical protein